MADFSTGTCRRVDVGRTSACAAVFLLLVAAGCQEPRTDAGRLARIHEMYQDYRQDFPNVPTITPDELARMRERQDVVVVDVREPYERAVSYIPGSIPVQEFRRHQEKYRVRTVVTYCTIGYRSGVYAKELREKGFDALNLEGSILMWLHAGYPIVDASGETKRVHVYGKSWRLAPEGYEMVTGKTPKPPHP